MRPCSNAHDPYAHLAVQPDKTYPSKLPELPPAARTHSLTFDRLLWCWHSAKVRMWIVFDFNPTVCAPRFSLFSGTLPIPMHSQVTRIVSVISVQFGVRSPTLPPPLLTTPATLWVFFVGHWSQKAINLSRQLWPVSTESVFHSVRSRFGFCVLSRSDGHLPNLGCHRYGNGNELIGHC